MFVSEGMDNLIIIILNSTPDVVVNLLYTD